MVVRSPVGPEPVGERCLDPDVDVDPPARGVRLQGLRHRAADAGTPAEHGVHRAAPPRVQLEAGQRRVGGAQLDAGVVEPRGEVVEADAVDAAVVEEGDVEGEVVAERGGGGGGGVVAAGDEVEGGEGGGVDVGADGVGAEDGEAEEEDDDDGEDEIADGARDEALDLVAARPVRPVGVEGIGGDPLTARVKLTRHSSSIRNPKKATADRRSVQ